MRILSNQTRSIDPLTTNIFVQITSNKISVDERLVAERDMTEDSVRERMRAQASDAAREAIADEVIRNDGTLEDLEGRVDALWRRLRARAT